MGAHREGATRDGSEKEGRQEGLVEEISKEEVGQEIGPQEAVAEEEVRHQEVGHEGRIPGPGLGWLTPCCGERLRAPAALRRTNNRLAAGLPRPAGSVC
ncbi:MAG TPA: hypothetical protein VGM76_02350 [Lacipirellulaceae bacterium]